MGMGIFFHFTHYRQYTPDLVWHARSASAGFGAKDTTARKCATQTDAYANYHTNTDSDPHAHAYTHTQTNSYRGYRVFILLLSFLGYSGRSIRRE